MIIGDLIDYLAEIYDSFVSSKETLEAKKQKEGQLSGRTTAFSSGLGYVVGGVYLLVGELLKSSLSSPKSIATVAIITPPIVSTVVFSLGMVYHAAQLVNMMSAKNPHPLDSAEYQEWATKRNIKISAHMTALGICGVFLAASLVPIPAMSNGLGVALITVMATISLADKMYGWAKKRLSTDTKLTQDLSHTSEHTTTHEKAPASSFTQKAVQAPIASGPSSSLSSFNPPLNNAPSDNTPGYCSMHTGITAQFLSKKDSQSTIKLK